MGRVLVTGAGGLVGSQMARLLISRSDIDGLLLASRRPDERLAGDDQKAQWIKLDLEEHDLSLPSDIDTIVHAAGEKLDSAKMTATNVDGTRRLVQAAARAGVRRFVHISSVGVYGAVPHSGVVDETFVRYPRNQYELSKEKGERCVRQVCEESGMQCFILQPSNVIAVHALAAAPLLGFLRAVRSGRLVRFGTSDVWLNYVAVEDVAAAALNAVAHAPAGGTYIINTPERLEDVLAWSAAALGVPKPKWRAPKWLGSIAASLGDFATEHGIIVPFDSNRLLEITNSTRFDGTGFSRATGFEYCFGVKMLISQLVDRYRREGRL
jgi:dihydroflavonol-4-reductase